MKEQIPLNENKLNQASKQALIALGQTPEPQNLYCLELADWSLYHRLQGYLEDSRMPDSLEAMRWVWPPEDVQKYLELAGDPETWAEIKDPEKLGARILVAITDNLTLYLPGYSAMTLMRSM